MRLSKFLVEKILNEDYSEKLTYHNRQHVENMLEGFGMWEDKNSNFPKELIRIGEASILFHDANYKVGDPKNEERASTYAKEVLLRYGWPQNDAQAVHDIILTTKPFMDFNPDFSYFKGNSNRYQGECCICKFHDLIDIIHDLDWIDFSNEDMLMEHHKKIFLEASYKGSAFGFVSPRQEFWDFEIRKNQWDFYKKLLDQTVLNGYLFRSPSFEHIPLETIVHNLENVIERTKEELREVYERLQEKVQEWNENHPDNLKEVPPNPFEEK